jgi:hypothetical protein
VSAGFGWVDGSLENDKKLMGTLAFYFSLKNYIVL